MELRAKLCSSPASQSRGTLMNLQNATDAGRVRHRAEDDHFHYDRLWAPKATECDTGLFSGKASARYWVINMRPRWTGNSAQPLVRRRSEG